MVGQYGRGNENDSTIKFETKVIKPNPCGGKVKHELRVTSSNPRVRRLKVRVVRLKARIGASTKILSSKILHFTILQYQMKPY